MVFRDRDSFERYLVEKDLEYVSRGNEGIFYHSKKDDSGYKVIMPSEEFVSHDLVATDIITKDDLATKYVLLPTELFRDLSNNVFGYKTVYIKNNYFKNGICISDINLDSIEPAFNNIKIELYELAMQGIKAIDIQSNLMFDGENIYAIDTCSYERTNKEEAIRYNIKHLTRGVKNSLLSLEDENGCRFFDLMGFKNVKNLKEYDDLLDSMSISDIIQYMKKKKKKY